MLPGNAFTGVAPDQDLTPGSFGSGTLPVAPDIVKHLDCDAEVNRIAEALQAAKKRQGAECAAARQSVTTKRRQMKQPNGSQMLCGREKKVAAALLRQLSTVSAQCRAEKGEVQVW